MSRNWNDKRSLLKPDCQTLEMSADYSNYLTCANFCVILKDSANSSNFCKLSNLLWHSRNLHKWYQFCEFPQMQKNSANLCDLLISAMLISTNFSRFCTLLWLLQIHANGYEFDKWLRHVSESFGKVQHSFRTFLTFTDGLIDWCTHSLINWFHTLV